MALPVTLYYLTNGTAARNPEVPDPAGAAERPEGTLVWLHVPRPEDVVVASDLIGRLSERDPELWFLVTTLSDAEFDWPDQCIATHPPPESRIPITRFIAAWKPDVAIWLGGELRPGLIEETAKADVLLYLLDTGNALAAAQYKVRSPAFGDLSCGALPGSSPVTR